MSNEILGDYACAVWKSQQAKVPGMSDEEMRTRSRMLQESFSRTTFVPFVVAAVIGLVFGVALLGSDGVSERAGASVGLLAAAYLVIKARRIFSRNHEHEVTCLRSYVFQLGQQRDALKTCGATFLLIGIACILLNVQENASAWRGLVSVVPAAGASVLSFIYVYRQAKRYQRRIDELLMLERS